MTAQEYQNEGYRVSLQTEQTIIDRIEGEVKINYIIPVAGTYDSTLTGHKAALMALAFIGLCQAQLFSSRTGGVRKNNGESEKAEFDTIKARCAPVAHALLKSIGDGSDPLDHVSDVYGIYYTTNFFFNSKD